jgi:alpha-D-xyloside xylohydrolase
MNAPESCIVNAQLKAPLTNASESTCNFPPSGGPNTPWSFGATATPILVELIKFREITLRPYVMSLAHRAAIEGEPPMRPLFYDFPNQTRLLDVDDQFMFGPSWLVAPVVQFGARSRIVHLPAGAEWQHYYTREISTGGQSLNVSAPLATFPLFCRGRCPPAMFSTLKIDDED